MLGCRRAGAPKLPWAPPDDRSDAADERPGAHRGVARRSEDDHHRPRSHARHRSVRPAVRRPHRRDVAEFSAGHRRVPAERGAHRDGFVARCHSGPGGPDGRRHRTGGPALRPHRRTAAPPPRPPHAAGRRGRCGDCVESRGRPGAESAGDPRRAVPAGSRDQRLLVHVDHGRRATGESRPHRARRHVRLRRRLPGDGGRSSPRGRVERGARLALRLPARRRLDGRHRHRGARRASARSAGRRVEHRHPDRHPPAPRGGQRHDRSRPGRAGPLRGVHLHPPLARTHLRCRRGHDRADARAVRRRRPRRQHPGVG
ncbi:hypothetical protein QE410_003151 [Microbacterium sp. SORGH_AS 1204]|nr:hypothetical protein [Microbacterium sp. SORGH_AS_1204]